MPLITFSNPEYKDKTVYAVAGSHTETVLKIAKEHRVPIKFDCSDGNCGTCMIKVTPLQKHKEMAGRITDKEIEILRQHGKLSKDELYNLEVTDIETQWRLACQFIVRDQDILVEY